MTLLAHASEPVLGWGMAMGGPARVVRPETIEEVRQALELARRQGLRVALRGSGCSYGDASCGRGKLVVDLSRMRQILSFDAQTGRIRAQAGVTLRDVWKSVLPHGWWPPVVSGTMEPTLGGAVAMNIHGKNAYKVGTIGEHVTALKILRVDGTLQEIGPGREPELFRAIVGGFGELAVIVEVELQLKHVYSGMLEVQALAAGNLDEMFTIFEQEEAAPSATGVGVDYLVGWIDAFASGKSLGRGLIHTARQLQPGEDPDAANTLQVASQELPSHLLGVIPKSWMWAMMKPFAHDEGMQLVNWGKYWSARLLGDGKRYRQSHAGFHFLLDYVPNWKWIYRPDGLIQHQIFVPKEHARQVFRQVLEMEHDAAMPTWLAVMKRHRPDPFLLTHGLDGYSLAQDFPVLSDRKQELWDLCHRIDDLVVQAGGRFYFAKDSTLRPETVAAAFPAENLRKFAKLRAELDPDGLLATDLYDRAVAPALAALAVPAQHP